MSKIKKFSNIVSTKMVSESTETEKGQAAVEALIKKMGYNSIEELKREKTLISKLENLMKEFSPKNDISEDEAEEIEDKIVKKGEPKSLEGDSGKKEEGGEVGTEDDEVTEDEAEDIEDKVIKKGEPKSLIDEDDDEDDDEDEDEEDDEEDDEEEVTVDVKEDESEDIEDETVEMGEPKDKSSELEDELEDEVTVKGKEVEKKGGAVLKTSKRILSFDQFIAEETINKNVSYQDDEEESEDNAVPVAASYQHKGGKSVNEAEISSDKEFKEYATKMLKNAFGGEYDETKANKTVDGIMKKYSGDYGAMVGALQSSMG